jgi:hypothetical protein
MPTGGSEMAVCRTACLLPSSAFVLNRPAITEFSYPSNGGAIPQVVRESRRGYGKPKRPLGPEAILHKAWRNAGLERASVRGRDGHSYRIVYGGKPGGSLGPDFTDAVVERDDGTVFRGDIEIHVRESDWRAHGHHTDPRYNGVVLHVVAADTNGRPALKATGSTIPLLALNWSAANASTAGPPNSTNPPIFESPGGRENPPLAEAGLERFHSQAAGIALDIDAFGADQAIWLGVMGALGYPRNKRAFRAVATRLDWDMTSSCDSPAELERLLIRAAGLDDSMAEHRAENPDNPSRPRPLRPTIARALRGTAPEWVRPWGRPANAPGTRIKALAALVPIWTAKGGIARVAVDAVSNARNPRELAAIFRPEHLVDDKDVTVIGATRAAEIVVNVLLPFVLAIASRLREPSPNATHLKNQALVLYSTHPRLAENSVTKEAKVALGLSYTVPAITNARDQQGLIALYREMFRHGIRPRQPRLPGV